MSQLLFTPLSEQDSLKQASVSELASLLKPRVMTLVVFTGAAGLLLAPGNLHPFIQLLAVACIALGSGAGGMMNMWYDRDIDAVMNRTKKRPLPTGKVHPEDVLAVGIMIAVASVALMGLATNWLAAGILAFAIFFYAVVYTIWLKRSTPQNIVIGGAAGAFPPMIGWVAVTGQLSVEPILLFAIIFLWTPPHFWALALFRHDDYKRAQIPMMPVEKGARSTQRQMLAYALLLLPVTIAPTFIDMCGLPYGVAAALLSGWLVWMCWRVMKSGDDHAAARALFGYSIFYLFALFSAMLLDAAFAPLLMSAF